MEAYKDIFFCLACVGDVVALAFYTWVFVQMRAQEIADERVPDIRLHRRDTPATTAVVIPARNEADSIEACLHSVCAQDGVSQVIVVDDHSEDLTAGIVERLRRSYPCLSILSAPNIPTGWLGKTHALDYGARAIQADYVLFIDADVILGPNIVRRSLDRMTGEGLDHLSTLFFIDCRTIGEKICAPALSISSSIALFKAALIKGSATGAFNMFRSSFYRSMGGHGLISSAVVDDVALARLAKARGAKSRFVFLGDSVQVRLFRGFSGFIAAVRRSALPYLAMRAIGPVLYAVGLAAIALVTIVSPAAWLLTFLEEGARGDPRVWTGCSLGIVAYGTGYLCALRSRRYHNAGVLWPAIYPVAMVLLAIAVIGAGLDVSLRRPLTWRGRRYELEQRLNVVNGGNAP